MKSWSVELRAKGLTQTIKLETMADTVLTHHILSTGTIVDNIFRVVTVDAEKRTALAIFERSRNVRMGRAR